MTVGNISSNNAVLTYAKKTKPAEEYYRQLLKEKQENASEELEKVQSQPVQTGSEKFTQKQWDSFLKNYDELTEYARARKLQELKEEKLCQEKKKKEITEE